MNYYLHYKLTIIMLFNCTLIVHHYNCVCIILKYKCTTLYDTKVLRKRLVLVLDRLVQEYMRICTVNLAYLYLIH